MTTSKHKGTLQRILPFAKYHALGNDMLVIDPARFKRPLTPPTIQLLCHRHFGLGSDGICYGPLPAPDGAWGLRFFNPDGTEAEKSGNGLRIFARYLWDAGYVNGRFFTLHINNEPIPVEILDDEARQMRLALGQASFLSTALPMTGPARAVVGELVEFAGERWQITAVSVGNPHCIIFTNNLDDIHRLGPMIENSPHFPQLTNVQLVRVMNDHAIELEIWERGAGYTLASGTSSSAAAAAAIRNGFCRSPVTAHMRGGTAQIFVDEAWRIEQIGSVTAVAVGEVAGDLEEEFVTSNQ